MNEEIKKVEEYDKIKIEDVKKTVANNLIFLRKKSGFTQQDVANRLDYSAKSVSKWENADSLPDISILSALCDMYGVTLDYLTHENAEEQAVFFKKNEKIEEVNRFIIMLMALMAVILVASIAFVYTMLFEKSTGGWRAFVWAVAPCATIIMYYCNKQLRLPKQLKIAKITLGTIICWSILTAIYLQFFNYRLWLIFILGIPIEIIIVLASSLKRRR